MNDEYNFDSGKEERGFDSFAVGVIGQLSFMGAYYLFFQMSSISVSEEALKLIMTLVGIANIIILGWALITNREKIFMGMLLTGGLVIAVPILLLFGVCFGWV